MSTESVKGKLSRAQEHLDAFEEHRLEWIASLSPGLDDHWVNEYTQQFTIHGVEQPPDRLSILIGDFAHNVRSALDHSVFDLWLNHSRPPDGDEIRRIQLPIEKTRERFESARERSLGGLSAAAVEAIEQLQPYNRPQSPLPAYPGQQSPDWIPERHPLWLLKQLSNVDKHRTLPLTVIQPVGHTFGGVIPPTLGQVVSSSTGPLSDGQEVLRFAYSTPEPSELISPQVHFDVGFGEQTDIGLDHRPLYPVKHHLNDILRFSRNEAVPELAAQLR